MSVHSYVAGEGVELTVHKGSVVVEKIKEVELRSRHTQLFMTEILIELGYSHAPSRLPVKKLRHLLHKRGKVRYWYGRVSGKISFLTIPPHSQLIHNHDTEVYAPIASCYKELNPFLIARLSAIIVSFRKRNLT